MTPHPVYTIVAVVLFGACDLDDASKAQAAAKTAAPTPTAAAPQGQTPPPAVADSAVPAAAAANDFTSCLLACDASKATHAEKATCRYNCEGSDAPRPTATGDVGADPVGFVVTCMDRCVSGGTPTPACSDACKTAVAGSPAAPSRTVLDELGTCLDGCRAAKHVNPTNHATCALNCTQTARVAGPAPTVAAKTP